MRLTENDLFVSRDGRDGSMLGISRDSTHKRRLTGGKRPYYRKKRKFCMGRQPSMTKVGTKVSRGEECRERHQIGLLRRNSFCRDMRDMEDFVAVVQLLGDCQDLKCVTLAPCSFVFVLSVPRSYVLCECEVVTLSTVRYDSTLAILLGDLRQSPASVESSV